jgi:photosystem II stability/assembly factor-like uncharacterized protein
MRRIAGLIAILFLAAPATSQTKFDQDLFGAMKWRSIGPNRGGRVTAVAGVEQKPLVYYFGATGGGVWKTEDGGLNWNPISDGHFHSGSIGAIEVSGADSNVIYVGTGEADIRSNFAEGDGVYKSLDAGQTWTNVGLKDTKQIGKIRTHPKNPDLVYVAALGNVFAPSKERGVFRSRDGGKTWQNVLFVDDTTGAVDIDIDPSNPRVLYAGFWHVRRKPWGMYSGGEAGGLYKSTDAGDTWTELTNGLPKGMRGRIGVTISPVNPARVWAIVEAKDGGMFRSDDAGKSWTKVNAESRIRDRPWYYSHIYSDPRNADTVYVLALQIYKSIDGGRTYSVIRSPHSDHHSLWIDPANPSRMINSNDGGANITMNGGVSWTTQDNQPTAQFYHVITDNQFPYRVYGSQQDNSSVSIAHRGSGQRGGDDRNDFYAVGGGEAGYIAPDPRDGNIVYAGSYYGLLTRYDHRTGQTQNISVWPESPGGRAAGDVKYRFQWTFPIVISPHDPSTIYAGANVLFKSTDEGRSWTPISGDLTRNDKTTLGPSGGPLTGDNSSADFYGTIFTVAESPRTKGLIWTGSDDGLVHVTEDGGKSWRNVTPRNIGEFARVHMIEASPFDPAVAYVAASRYQTDDRKPYIFKTTDIGKTWTLLTAGIPDGSFVRVVREDPERKGLLYAGTEHGVFVSLNAGQNWQPLQFNLPEAPVTDLIVKEGDLVASTQGRAFWVLDDLSAIRQSQDRTLTNAQLFKPRQAYRTRGGRAGIYYYLPESSRGGVSLEFQDATGKTITTVGNAAAKPGLNFYEWDMRYPGASAAPQGHVIFGGGVNGPVAVPGKYQVKLTAGGASSTETFEIKKDPRLSTTDQDFQKQFDLLINVRDKLTATHDAVRDILRIQGELKVVLDRAAAIGATQDVATAAGLLDEGLGGILDELIQMKSGFSNDVLSYPVKLNALFANLTSVVDSADAAPTSQSYDVFKALSSRLDEQLSKLNRVLQKDVPAINDLVRQRGIPAIVIKK